MLAQSHLGGERKAAESLGPSARGAGSPRGAPARTIMGWRWPSCQTTDICREAWWKLGSVAITVPRVASLVVGGGIRMVQGALGTQEYQSS